MVFFTHQPKIRQVALSAKYKVDSADCCHRDREGTLRGARGRTQILISIIDPNTK